MRQPCRQRIASRAHGLCGRCSLSAAIRGLYPSTNKYGIRSGTGSSGRELPPATDAEPGTAAKVAVLQERARLQLALWNPADPVVMPAAAPGKRVYRFLAPRGFDPEA